MSSVETFNQGETIRQANRLSMLIFALLLGAAAVGLMLPDKAFLPFAVVVTLLTALACWKWPDYTVLIVVGLLYSNLPVVAVQFHGAPAALPAAVLALLGWPLLFRLLIKKESIQLCSAFAWVSAYAIVQFVGAILSRYPQLAFDNFVSFLAEGFLVYFAITNVIRTRRMLMAVCWVLVLCAILMGGAPLIQQVIGSPNSNLGGLAQADSAFMAGETAAGVDRQQRFAGTIGEQNRYAQFMILLLPICLANVSLAKNRYQLIIAISGTLLALIGFSLAFSRGAAVGLAIAMFFGFCLKLFSRRQLQVIGLGILMIPFLFPQYLTRLASITNLVGNGRVNVETSDGAVRGRLTEMGAAVMVFRDHMIVGVGPGMFGEYSLEYGQRIGLRSLEAGRQAHSLPLDIAAENGLLGLVTFFGAIAVVGLSLYRSRKQAIQRGDMRSEGIVTACLMVILVYFSTALFLHLSYIRYFWLVLALGDAAAKVTSEGDTGGDYLSPEKPSAETDQASS